MFLLFVFLTFLAMPSRKVGAFLITFSCQKEEEGKRGAVARWCKKPSPFRYAKPSPGRRAASRLLGRLESRTAESDAYRRVQGPKRSSNAFRQAVPIQIFLDGGLLKPSRRRFVSLTTRRQVVRAAAAAGAMFHSGADFGVGVGSAFAVDDTPSSSGVLLCPDGKSVRKEISVDAAIALITRDCASVWIDGIKRGGGLFVHRGEGLGGKAAFFPCHVDDLLGGNGGEVQSVYGKGGAEYFQWLEKSLKERESPVVPSTAHLATSDVREATKWGAAASIWPLGEVHFGWLPSGPPTFYSGENDRRIPKVDKGLGQAIEEGREVLFCSSDGYVAVDGRFEAEVRAGLDLLICKCRLDPQEAEPE
uniref:Uncharacterized protein n=1 Tax=Chromera velia CCMP2878 TaxID=1169474 RepID=A0A0G4HTI5_9ALVE|eukprot:Cvel_31349.t1-p1 / transcript=Cvel_31349.t1 / gene=Cvel_31349 / organism=Chromera_velia_CCMP2878 / gene_product=hypothetical protein / transcript_product=hypothetical protein / location=Cvel_scaffold4658:230-1312(-) / protein_length=361 / sequence_SO=supercontig / SO=protein_coding / is_pseudo=false